ncbi:MAG: hypothetical protein ACLPWS_04015 [Rhodomicrobium sp.]
MRGVQEDPGLAEVKAVLRKLQRLDPVADAGHDQANQSNPGLLAAPAHPSSPPVRADISIFDRKHAAIAAAGPKTRPKRRIALQLFSAGVLIGGVAILFAAGTFHLPKSLRTGTQTKDTAAIAQTKESESKLLAEERRILSEGDVILARSRLLRDEPGRRPEVAFMLAQSYDPNYLQSLAKTNGLPDPAEAERWYKRWHELAAQSGLEMDSGRLQRIINAMH